MFQVVNALFPALGFPPWTVSLSALLFLAGFPIAVALAWMFEITPEGIRMVPGDRRKFGAGQHGWIDWLIASVVAVAFAFAIVQIFNIRGLIAESVAGVSSQSVAVLPFQSFSSAQEDGFFADGLTEELINSLAQSPELKVAGRTSAFYFKGRNVDLREIGRQLGVAHLVEGSVRRSGERMRITAQLISVKDGTHLWSKTYDRTVDDTLAIQTEVADAVADSLKAKLVHEDQPAPAAQDPDDYRLALIAKGQLRTNDVDELRAARSAFEELRRRRPDSAEAHAGYAQATIFLAQNFLALPFEQAQREARQAIEQAIKADPRSADAWRARGAFERVTAIRTAEGSHHAAALAAFRKAFELDPKDPDTMILLANQLITQGQSEQAIDLVRKALATDPLSRVGQEVLASTLAAEGRYEEARRSFETLLSLYPDYTSGATSFGAMLIMKQGKLDEAARLLDNPKLSADDPINAILLSNALANMGLQDEAEAALEAVSNSEARPIAHAAALQLQGKRSELLSFALQEQRRTGDPIWNGVQVTVTALMGEYGAARAAIPASFPGMLKDPPDVEGYREMDILLAAATLRHTGGEAQANRILESLLERLPAETLKGGDQLASRAMVLAALGRRDEAAAAFERAAAGGWRTLIDFDYFVPIEQYPFMAEMARDPRFRKVIAGIEADLARMRENVVRERQARGAAPKG